MRLRHLHLQHPIDYSYSLRLQEALLQRNYGQNSTFFKHARSPGSSAVAARGACDPLEPTLLTFQTNPTYTVGRRHLKNNPLSASQIDFLTGQSPALTSDLDRNPPNKGGSRLAKFYASPRGGLLTYHAPGQLTAYLIYNLRAYGITPRCHIRLLENAVMRVCASHGVPNTVVTDDPGVWIANAEGIGCVSRQSMGTTNYCGSSGSRSSPSIDTGSRTGPNATDRKICAIGVHVSRGITSHGIGLNVHDTPIPAAEEQRHDILIPIERARSDARTHAEQGSTSSLWTSTLGTPGSKAAEPSTTNVKPHFTSHPDRPYLHKTSTPGYLSWGFGRIVACGLEGKSVTWLSREQQQEEDNTKPNLSALNSKSCMQDIADTLALEVVRGLSDTGTVKVQGVEQILEDAVLT